MVSTVGEYFPDPKGEMESLGAGSQFYETYVFRYSNEGRCECGCGLPIPDSWGEIDGVRTATPKEARAEHMLMCYKYEQMTPITVVSKQREEEQ